jgi:hypothetical protein
MPIRSYYELLIIVKLFFSKSTAFFFSTIAKGWRINKCPIWVKYFCARQGGKNRVMP